MIDAAGAIGRTVGERVFVDGDERQNLCGIERGGDSVCVTPAASRETTKTATIQEL